MMRHLNLTAWVIITGIKECFSRPSCRRCRRGGTRPWRGWHSAAGPARWRASSVLEPWAGRRRCDDSVSTTRPHCQSPGHGRWTSAGRQRHGLVPCPADAAEFPETWPRASPAHACVILSNFIHQRMIEKKTNEKQYTINTKIQSAFKIIKRSLVCSLQNIR